MKAENLNFNEKDVSEIRKKVFLIWLNCVALYKLIAKDTPVSLDPVVLHEGSDVLDRWIMTKLDALTLKVTEYMDGYDLVRASRELMAFVSDLSGWYVRRSRDRLKAAGATAAGGNAGSQTESLQVYGHVLARLAQLFAPFTPFFSEFVWHQLVNAETSVHHSDWPHALAPVNADSLDSMDVVRQVVEKGLAARLSAGLKVRQPLAVVTVASPFPQPVDELLALIREELNVKKVVWQKASSLTAQLDTTLTDELLTEGTAREVMRSIQRARKEAGLQFDQPAAAHLLSWPDAWQAEIERKTNTRLIQDSSVEEHSVIIKTDQNTV